MTIVQDMDKAHQARRALQQVSAAISRLEDENAALRAGSIEAQPHIAAAAAAAEREIILCEIRGSKKRNSADTAT
jgi:hypothetical protein